MNAETTMNTQDVYPKVRDIIADVFDFAFCCFCLHSSDNYLQSWLIIWHQLQLLAIPKSLLRGPLGLAGASKTFPIKDPVLGSFPGFLRKGPSGIPRKGSLKRGL